MTTMIKIAITAGLLGLILWMWWRRERDWVNQPLNRRSNAVSLAGYRGPERRRSPRVDARVSVLVLDSPKRAVWEWDGDVDSHPGRRTLQ